MWIPSENAQLLHDGWRFASVGLSGTQKAACQKDEGLQAAEAGKCIWDNVSQTFGSKLLMESLHSLAEDSIVYAINAREPD